MRRNEQDALSFRNDQVSREYDGMTDPDWRIQSHQHYTFQVGRIEITYEGIEPFYFRQTGKIACRAIKDNSVARFVEDGIPEIIPDQRSLRNFAKTVGYIYVTGCQLI